MDSVPLMEYLHKANILNTLRMQTDPGKFLTLRDKLPPSVALEKIIGEYGNPNNIDTLTRLREDAMAAKLSIGTLLSVTPPPIVNKLAKRFNILLDTVTLAFNNWLAERYVMFANRHSTIDYIKKVKVSFPLPIQRDLANDLILCLESGAIRPSYVVAWNLAIEQIKRWLFVISRLKKFNAKSAKQVVAFDDFDSIPDFKIIETASDARLIQRKPKDFLHGKLKDRHHFAHASQRETHIDSACGYARELIDNVVLHESFKIRRTNT